MSSSSEATTAPPGDGLGGDPPAPLPMIVARGLVKRFPGVVACDHASLQVTAGEIHAVVGENGAGKSTLLSLLAGLYLPEEGEISLAGQPVRLSSPRVAAAHGIAMVHQHFALIGKLSVTDNLLLAERGPWLLSRRRRAELAARIASLAAQHGLPCHPAACVADLSVAEQQRVEILKALAQDARVLLFDEPTAVLTPVEAEALRRALLALRQAGRTIVYVSHKLDEVFALADRITVMRGGRTVLHAVPTNATTPAEVAREIIGPRAVGSELPTPPSPSAPPVTAAVAPVLELVGLSAHGALGTEALCQLSISVRAGEIYGLAGVAGNGQSELAEVLCGLRAATSGEVRFSGEAVNGLSIAARRARGLSRIPEDRYAEGCAAALSLQENVLLTHLDAAELRSRLPGLLSPSKVQSFVRRALAPLHLPPSLLTHNPPAGALSGGTLQKLILARELAHKPRILLAAYPCRGLDLGATQTVHTLLRQARDSGCAVLLISEQLGELLALCDRVGALLRGRLVGELDLSAGTSSLDAEGAHRRLGNLISGLPIDAADTTDARPTADHAGLLGEASTQIPGPSGEDTR